MNSVRLLHEVADVARGLARRPLVPATLAAVVAVGVAFLVTAFGVFDAMLWRDLPYGPRARFLLLGEVRESEGYPPMPRLRVDTYAGYREAFARGRLPVLDGLVPLEEREVNLLVDGVATRTRATRLLPESFAVVQARPILGRTPADPDGSGRLAREVAIGERLWTRRFARDPGVLGRTVAVDGETATIVGVLPAEFSFHRFSELWTAWSEREILADPTASILVVGRVAEGRDREEVGDFTNPVRLAVRAERVPVDTTTRAYHAHGLFGTDFIHPTFARYVFGMLALVLVAACLNVATLFLARLRGRVPEYATRQALGAGAAGVLRLLLVEAALVVAIGGIAGAGLAAVAMLLVRDAASGVLLSWMDVRLEWRSAVVALLAAAVALVVVALPAARALGRLDLARLLVHAGVIGRAPRHGRGASALVAAQVALVVLLAAAALPIAVSAVKLADVRSGVDDDRVVTVWASLTGVAYESDEARDGWVARARDALLRDPRVERVSRVGGLRRWRSGSTVWSDTLWTDAEARWLPGRRSFRVAEHVVSDDYFAAVGLPLLAGRALDGSERAGGEYAAVLSAEAARRLFPGTSPLGRRYRRGAEGPWLRVVGVVGDQTAIWGDWTGTTAAPDPRVYVSERQATTSVVELHVRVRQATPELLRDVRRLVERVDLTQGVGRVRLLADEFAQSRVERRWIAVVLGSGALVTVLLSTMGVVGLVSYYTAARLPELALRVALGAPARRVAWLVARGTLRSVAIGVALGVLALTVVQDGVRRFLYETSTGDPVVLALVALTTLVVALAALVVPLRRLRRLSPQELLRR